MSRSFKMYWKTVLRAPRASGDEPPVARTSAATFFVLPARAGMSPCRPTSPPHGRCAPRASGDEPFRDSFDKIRTECSPRERG